MSSIFPRLNQRMKVILPIRTNLTEYNEVPEHTIINTDTEIPSTLDGPTVVQRYRNLTISAGCMLTTQYRCCGLALVVDGDLTINGSISMTARGASFIPKGDHLIKNTLLPGNDVVYEIDIPATANEIADFLKKEKRRYHSLDELPAIYRPTLYAKGPMGNVYFPSDLGSVPIVGGAGGAAMGATGEGWNGTAGTNRGCGGGGGGARYSQGTSGGGGAGSCYSGGAGGGGCYASGTAGTGSSYGGAGGNGKGSAGGGAGNPGGTGDKIGGTGTGGLLIIVCTGKVTINASGSITSGGVAGGAGKYGGGGSGGGSINIFHSSFVNNGILSALGGPSVGSVYKGGAGGAGCVTLDQYNF